MANSILQGVLAGNAKVEKQMGVVVSNLGMIHKEQQKQSGLLEDIYKNSVDELKLSKQREQRAKREAQEAKKRSGDKSPASILQQNNKEQKKGNDFLSKMLGLLGGLGKGLAGLGPLLAKALGIGALASLGKMIVDRLFNKQTMDAIRAGIERMFQGLRTQTKNLFAGIKTQLTAFMASLKRQFSNLGTKLFGKGTPFQKGMEKLFGQNSLIRKSFNKFSTIIDDVAIKMRRLIPAIAMPKGGMNPGRMLGNIFGKTKVGKAVRGGALTGLISGIQELIETQSASQATAVGLGAGGGTIGGAKIGAAIGTAIAPGIGTAIGGVIGAIAGAITGEEVARVIFKKLNENDTFRAVTQAFDGFVKGLYEFQKGIFDGFRPFFKKVIKFAKALGAAFQRLVKDVVGVAKAIGDFTKSVWKKFTDAVGSVTKFFKNTFTPVFKKVTNFLDRNVSPVLKEVAKFLKPIVDPLKKLATQVLDPLVKGFSALTELIGNFIQNFDPRKAGQVVGSAITAVPGAVLDFATQGLTGFANRREGGLVPFTGIVPDMGGDGDRFPAMLAENSVVLNQRAARYQKGGMIPTLLERGEKVYGPNDPMAGPALMMNSMIPRFQSGGEVTPEAIKEGAEKNKGTEAPSGTKVLSVPYYNQRQNKTDSLGTTGNAQCFSTSAAMVTSAVLNKEIIPDVFNQVRQKYGSSIHWPPNQSAMSDFGVPAGGGDNGSYKSYKSAIDAGKPVILGLNHSTNSGHMVAGIGYSNDGLIVNDPYGRLNSTPKGGWAAPNLSGEKDTKGKGITYPKSLMDAIWLDRGPGTGRMYVPNQGGVKPGEYTGSNLGGGPGGSNLGGDLGGNLGGNNIVGALGASMGVANKLMSGLKDAFMDVFGDQLGFFGDMADSFVASLFGASPVNAASVGPGPEGPGSTAGPESPGSTAGPVSVTPGAKGLLDFIAAYESEGDYNKIFGGESIPGLTNKTIAEVVEIQKAHLRKGYESAAIGRYQMMLPDEYARRAGLSMSDKFSEENQDKMAMVYLEEDGYSKFKAGTMSAETFANNVAGTWAAMPTSSGSSFHQGVGSNKALVDYNTYMQQIRASKMQSGGVANVGRSSAAQQSLMQKSQEEFAQKIAQAITPVVIPVPMGGGTADTVTSNPGDTGVFPMLPSEDPSLVAMEYKYKRITMGASV